MAACSLSDSAEQDLQSLSSSAATVEMTLSAYLERSVPAQFAKRALEESSREQQKLLSDLDNSKQQGSGGEAARSLIQATFRAQAAVARSDRAEALHVLDDVITAAKHLRDLAWADGSSAQ